MKSSHLHSPSTSRAWSHYPTYPLRASDLDLILDHGTQAEDGCVLTRRDINEYEARVKRELQRLWHLEGTAIIEQGGTIVSVYRTTKRKRRDLLHYGA